MRYRARTLRALCSSSIRLWLSSDSRCVLLRRRLMISDTLIIALTASTVAPAALAFLTYWIQRANKKLDWAREDEIARKAETSRKETQKKLDVTTDKLDEIHALVKNNNNHENTDTRADTSNSARSRPSRKRTRSKKTTKRLKASRH